jgi:hydrogenase maturation protease
MSTKPHVLVLGLGNELLGDDAVGIIVTRELHKQLSKFLSHKASFIATNDFGYVLLDLIEGYDRLIVIDSVKVAPDEVGSIRVLDLDDMPSGLLLPHELSLKDLISMGRQIGLEMPSDVKVIAIGIEGSYFQLSERVKNALPKILEEVKLLVLKFVN